MSSDRIPASQADPLSAGSAFVVHLIVLATDPSGCVAGRVEHVTSGRWTRFASSSELIGFMQETLLEAAGRRIHG